MNQEDLELWASAYIEANSGDRQPSNKDATWWAIERAMPVLGKVAPDDLWSFILEVLRRAPPSRVVEVLAAGPLEDFIVYFGADEIDKIESEARCNPAFRGLLGGVWQNRTPAEIWARVERARGDPW